CGLVSGLLVAYLRLPPFVTTLAVMTIARGAALITAPLGVRREFMHQGSPEALDEDGVETAPLPSIEMRAAVDTIFVGRDRAYNRRFQQIERAHRLVAQRTRCGGTDFCVAARNEAAHHCGPPEIMNADRASQFTSCAWVDRLMQFFRHGQEAPDLVNVHEFLPDQFITEPYIILRKLLRRLRRSYR
ncbi:hypothetical protein VB636_04255, partial [Paracoccus sp. APAP_BH8]